MPLLAKHRLSSSRAPLAFDRVVRTLATKLAYLLQTPVYVVDRQERLVASSEGDFLGQSLTDLLEDGVHPVFRAPFEIRGGAGEVVVTSAGADVAEPDGVLRAVVRQLVYQIANPQQTPVRRLPKDRLVYDLLRGAYHNEDELVEQALLIGLDLTSPRSVILIDAASYILAAGRQSSKTERCQEQRRAQDVIRRAKEAFSGSGDVFCAYLGHGRVVALKSGPGAAGEPAFLSPHHGSLAENAQENQSEVEQLGRWLSRRLANGSEPEIMVSVGGIYTAPGGLSRSYQEALTALHLDPLAANTGRAVAPRQQLNGLAHQNACNGGKRSGLS